LAILATVAIIAYKQYADNAHDSEAMSVLADIKIKQEAYRSTFHQYMSIPSWAPTKTPPSSSSLLWTSNATTKLWHQLGVTPDSSVYFRYYIEAGNPGVAPTVFAGLNLENQNDFWFGARAIQDINDNKKCSGFEIYSGQSKIVNLGDETANHCKMQ
jgi:type II secretory pathway pseudopilin PulG